MAALGDERKMIIKNNSLNTIRLLAAIQVMWGHMTVHLNVSDFLIGEVSFHSIISMILGLFPGVPIFFSLAGF